MIKEIQREKNLKPDCVKIQEKNQEEHFYSRKSQAYLTVATRNEVDYLLFKAIYFVD